MHERNDAIFAAIRSGDDRAVAALIGDRPELANARNSDGLSALMYALYRRRTDAAAAIRRAKGELDVFEAAAVGDTGRVAELLEADRGLASAGAPDAFFPLHIAAFFGHVDVARVLLDAGADADAVAENWMGGTALHSAVAAGASDVCELLIDRGADVNARQHGGWTPLQGAAEHGDEDLVERLLAAGADPGATNDDGKSAADLARAAGHERVAERLGRAAITA